MCILNFMLFSCVFLCFLFLFSRCSLFFLTSLLPFLSFNYSSLLFSFPSSLFFSICLVQFFFFLFSRCSASLSSFHLFPRPVLLRRGLESFINIFSILCFVSIFCRISPSFLSFFSLFISSDFSVSVFSLFVVTPS